MGARIRRRPVRPKRRILPGTVTDPGVSCREAAEQARARRNPEWQDPPLEQWNQVPSASDEQPSREQHGETGTHE
ncbi:hypothetical protein LTV02_00495 [Nocardia yamanashiensis]|uniref:hypothetical protein n=1 Tax=Nocardia yamanashiensis TaxID=209247 RepID=UPI001E449A81|nr:hypothetical protein [Nocardia yamanashiensis]UGT41946.1 hypothetical protein LTV02_00495 [Nocardia yamanashiensis]